MSAVDKSKWPDGAWMFEPDELRFTHRGLDCLVWRTRSVGGHFCGYVRVPEDHPLQGMDYTCTVPAAQFEDAEVNGADMGQMLAVLCGAHEASQTGAMRLDAAIQVHGSLTFAGKLRDEDGWWLGFDCGHYLDISPGRPTEFWEGQYRSISYVEDECRKLAEQIAAVTEVVDRITPEDARAEMGRKSKERAAKREASDA